MPPKLSELGGAYFKLATSQAQMLAAAEAAGANTDSFDFSTKATCSQCGNMIEDTTPKVCSECKAAIYCSKKCSVAGWKTRKVPNAQTHKELCRDNKRHMLRTPEVTALLMQFPWGRLERDGTFSVDIARGRFNVLGDRCGFWSHRGGPMSHLPSGSAVEEYLFKQGNGGAFAAQISKAFHHVDGTALLEATHPTDCEGWKLEPELIPFLKFSSPWEPPQLASTVEIKDWDSWYSWRRIPKTSPAALLMHFPMSVYWLLVDTLHVTNPNAGSPDARVKLDIQYIAAEVELNFLPLFGELALLLPYTDIKMTCFGQAVHKIVSQAKASHPKSLAAQTSPTVPVYSYTAPEASGAGCIQIFLHGSTAHWTPADAHPALSAYGPPDAIVAPNAGLGSYVEWYPVILYAHQMGIPFGSTEYAEQSSEMQVKLFSELLWAEAERPGSVMGRVPGAPDAEACRRAAAKRWEYAIELNPFQRPGQRTVPTKVPNVPNGFTIRVVGK
ncbi:hypothetical protein DFH09DRAFT_1192039 [Mycena vulgaris]|nr:hypothetical protein DFH09DRAFT_1192039 [Mycena vulgaris]